MKKAGKTKYCDIAKQNSEKWKISTEEIFQIKEKIPQQK